MKPYWLKKKLSLTALQPMQRKLRALNLHTVCEEAHCPNISECFGRGIATIMIMGDVCTRACKFCAVATGRPKPLDPDEPFKTAQWARNLGLRHLVITSVDRDDLPDLGATHFAETVRELRKNNSPRPPRTPPLPCPSPSRGEGKREGVIIGGGVGGVMTVEVLTPDFQGKKDLISLVAEAGPEIYNHNLETVERLTPRVRSASKYARSLSVISHVKKNFPHLAAKSGLMLGLGETEEEVAGAMKDLRDHGCDLLTLGQYLQPTPKHLPVIEYIHPDRFEAFKKIGEEIGFKAVSSGPFVRSSYMAENFFQMTKSPDALQTGL